MIEATDANTPQPDSPQVGQPGLQADQSPETPRPAVAARIPSEIWARLVELRPLLVKQGYVSRRSDKTHLPGWLLRYRKDDPDCGYRKNFSLSLGPDDNVAAAVFEVMQLWRQEHREQQEALKQKKKALETFALQVHRWARQLGADDGAARIAARAALLACKEFGII